MKIFATHEQAQEYLESLPPDAEAQAAATEKAEDCFKSSRDSFERCDTDGFLSQWASDMTAREHQLEAEIASHGGCAVFDVLLRLDGTFASSSLWRFPNRFAGYGSVMKWRVCNPDGTVTWVSDYRKDSSFEKKGFRRGYAVAAARPSHLGNIINRVDEPRGLAGCTNMTYRPRMVGNPE